MIDADEQQRAADDFVNNDGWEYCEYCDNPMEHEDCWSCGGEGEHEAYELDPMWYRPGDTERCDICYGDGRYWVCLNSACPGKRES